MGTPSSELCISDFFDSDTLNSNPTMSGFLKKASKFFLGTNGKKKETTAKGNGHEEKEENQEENDGNKEADESENKENWGNKLKNRGKLFVGGLNPGTTAQNMEIYFSRFGKVMDSVVMRFPKTGRSRGFGFVTFADPADAEMALQGSHTLDGKVLEIRPFGQKKAENRVFLGGIPETVEEKDLKEFFTRYGEVTSVYIVSDRVTKKPKGCAFLSFKDAEAREKCLSERFVYIGGKRVLIREAEPRGQSKTSDPDLSEEEDFDVEEGHGEDSASVVDDETSSSVSEGQWATFDQDPRFQKLFEDFFLSKTKTDDMVNDAKAKEWNESAQSQEKKIADVEKLLMSIFLNPGSGMNVDEEENLIDFSTDEETREEGTSDDGDSSADELDDILNGNRYSTTANDSESPNLFIQKGSLWCSLCQWRPPNGTKESFLAHCQTPAHRLKTQERFNVKQNQVNTPDTKSIFTTATTMSESLEKRLIGEIDSKEGEKVRTKQERNPKEPQMKQQKQPQQQLHQKKLQQDQTQQKVKQQQQVQQLQQQKAKQKQPQEPQQKLSQQQQEQQPHKQKAKQKQPQEQQQKVSQQQQQQQQQEEQQPHKQKAKQKQPQEPQQKLSQQQQEQQPHKQKAKQKQPQEQQQKVSQQQQQQQEQQPHKQKAKQKQLQEQQQKVSQQQQQQEQQPHKQKAKQKQPQEEQQKVKQQLEQQLQQQKAKQKQLQKQPQEQQQKLSQQQQQKQQQKQLQQKKEHQQQNEKKEKKEVKTKQGQGSISNLKIHALAKGMVSIQLLSGNSLHCKMCGKTIPQAQDFATLMKNLSQHLQSKRHLNNLTATENSLKNALEENPK